MNADELPEALPCDASRNFGRDLIKHVIPELVGYDDGINERATIAKNGKLMPKFAYLKEYNEGKHYRPHPHYIY